MVLDNARDAEQVRPLLPGSAGCLVVVTSRNQLTGLVAADGAHPLSLALLTVDEARDLLARRLGADRVAAEPDAVDEIIARCARLPLALAIVAARAATHPEFPLAALADELRDAAGGLDAFAAGDAATDVRTVFSWSYRALSADAARLFRLLGLHPGPDITPPPPPASPGNPADRSGTLLAELTRAHLLTEHAPGRYAFHDLLRAYATDLTHTVDTDEQRQAATHRLLDHYLHTAHTADRLLQPRDPIPIPSPHPDPASTPEHLPPTSRQALDWFTAEHQVLLAAVDLAADTGFDTHTWQLAWALGTFLHRRGHWHDLATAWQTALAAADRLGRPRRAGPPTAASPGPTPGWAGTTRPIPTCTTPCTCTPRPPTRSARPTPTSPSASCGSGRAGPTGPSTTPSRPSPSTRPPATGAGRPTPSTRSAGTTPCSATTPRPSPTASRPSPCTSRLGDRDGEADTWDSLGYAHHHLGHHAQAADCYQHALTLFRDLGDRYNEADTLTHLGDTHQVGSTLGYGRSAGFLTCHHGSVRRVWVYPLRRDAAAILPRRLTIVDRGTAGHVHHWDRHDPA